MTGRIHNMRVVLSLKNFGVAFGKKVILDGVDLEVPEKGVFVLMGPVGTGKSTLLRTLAGYNTASPHLRTWGTAHYLGTPLAASRPALVMQKACLLMSTVMENVIYELPQKHSINFPEKELLARQIIADYGLASYFSDLNEDVVSLPLHLQRLIAVLRVLAANPPLLAVDEPTSDIEDQYAEILLRFIESNAVKRAIIVVLHNQKHARCLHGKTALLAGGKIQGCNDTDAFFSNPESDLLRNFIRSGSCFLPSPGALKEELDPEISPNLLSEQARSFVSQSVGPRNFLWLIKGSLAGTPRPGLLVDLHDDLTALQRVGVTVLVSLTTHPVDSKLAGRFGMKIHHFPIKDMGVPSAPAARKLCQDLRSWIDNLEVVAVHCKAGLGRTGTMLACYLIYKGATALEALEQIRRINPQWIQSDEQVNFLQIFEDYPVEAV